MGRTKERTSRWSVLPFACALVWASASSCSTDKSDPNGPVSSTDCQQLMSVYCNKLAACDPVGVRRQFGDVQVCVDRQTLACPNLSLTGSGWTSGKIQQCTAQINASTSCYGDTFGADACNDVPGTLPPGAPCEQSSQCASDQCDRSIVLPPDGGVSTPACGVCLGRDAGTSVPTCGDAGACQSPQRCVYDNNDRTYRCLLPQPEGAPCTATSGCVAGLFCRLAASDGGASVCSQRGEAGAACTGSSECDTTRGLRCIAGVCDAPTLVPAGGTCDGTGRLCEKGAHCFYASAGMMTGICQAPAEDGSRCDTSTGLYCRDPASCRDGICHLPGDAQCR